MTTEIRKAQTSRFVPVAIGIALPTLFLIFRFTAAAAFLILLVMCILFRRRRSPRPVYVAFALFVAAILIPLDVYVPGFHGPLIGSKHSGLRFVHVVGGMPRIRACLDRYGEFIAGGCIVGIHDTQWQLVWD